MKKLNPILEKILIERHKKLSINEALMDEPISSLEKEEAKKQGKTGTILSPEEIANVSKILISVTPILGDAMGVYDAALELSRGDSEAAKLALFSAIPLIGIPADAIRAKKALDRFDKIDSISRYSTKNWPIGPQTPPKTTTTTIIPPDWQSPKPALPGSRPIEVPSPRTPGYPKPAYPSPEPIIPVEPKPLTPNTPPSPSHIPSPSPSTPSNPPTRKPRPRDFDFDIGDEEESVPGYDLGKNIKSSEGEEVEAIPQLQRQKERVKRIIKTLTKTKDSDDDQEESKVGMPRENQRYSFDQFDQPFMDVDLNLEIQKILGKYAGTYVQQ